MTSSLVRIPNIDLKPRTSLIFRHLPRRGEDNNIGYDRISNILEDCVENKEFPALGISFAVYKERLDKMFIGKYKFGRDLHLKGKSINSLKSYVFKQLAVCGNDEFVISVEHGNTVRVNAEVENIQPHIITRPSYQEIPGIPQCVFATVSEHALLFSAGDYNSIKNANIYSKLLSSTYYPPNRKLATSILSDPLKQWDEDDELVNMVKYGVGLSGTNYENCFSDDVLVLVMSKGMGLMYQGCAELIEKKESLYLRKV